MAKSRAKAPENLRRKKSIEIDEEGLKTYGEIFEIPYTDGLYYINKKGQVLSAPRPYGAGINKTIKGWTELIGWISKSGGYKMVTIYAKNKKTKQYVHILMRRTFFPDEKGEVTRHLNDIPTDNRLENLKVGTYLENSQDCFKNGGFRVGEKHQNAKLTDLEVVEIKEAYSTGSFSMSQLGKQYGVCPSNIHKIIHNQSRSR